MVCNGVGACIDATTMAIYRASSLFTRSIRMVNYCGSSRDKEDAVQLRGPTVRIVKYCFFTISKHFGRENNSCTTPTWWFGQARKWNRGEWYSHRLFYRGRVGVRQSTRRQWEELPSWKLVGSFICSQVEGATR